MGKNNEITPPGSLQERFVSFIWYGVIMAGWLGIISFLDEAFHTVKKFNFEAIPKRSGEVVVLTGGTRGIGFDILKKLLQLDFHVIMGVRKIEAGLAAIETIRKSGVNSGTTQVLPLDLKSLTSVRKFGETIMKEKDRIDILLNNAGIMFEPYELTVDGFESQFQVNYLSHFLLTQILLPKLKSTGAKKSTCCRIVNVSSIAHTASAIRNVKELASPNMYSGFRAYYDSKLCQVLSTTYLDARLKLEGSNVHVYAVHPGVIPTGLYTSIGIFGQIMHWLGKFYRNSDEGAEIVMYAAISPEVESEGGLYIQNSEKRTPNKIAEDHTIQKTLWELSEICVEAKRRNQRSFEGAQIHHSRRQMANGNVKTRAPLEQHHFHSHQQQLMSGYEAKSILTCIIHGRMPTWYGNPVRWEREAIKVKDKLEETPMFKLLLII